MLAGTKGLLQTHFAKQSGKMSQPWGLARLLWEIAQLDCVNIFLRVVDLLVLWDSSFDSNVTAVQVGVFAKYERTESRVWRCGDLSSRR